MDTNVLIIVGIIAVAIPLWLILRSRFRKSMAESFPNVTYVDETFHDLIRTRQIRAARDYYQEHTRVSDEEADKVVEYLVVRPESLMLMVRLQDETIAPLFTDATLLQHIESGKIFKAIQYYSNQTGADLRETEVAVYAIAANPTMTFKRSKNKRE
ncbi:MAG: hypothetical protein AAFN11_03030 [Chloroflexota bacterium]